MKIFCLYYKQKFVVAFNTREECITYGKEHYDNEGWDCNIIEKFLTNSPQHPLTTLTPKQTIPCTVSDVPHPFTIDYSQTPKTNEWNETGDGV